VIGRVFSALVLLLAGCTRAVASPSVRTAALIAEIEVTSTRDGEAELRTRLRTEGPSGAHPVTLGDGDHLDVRAGGRQARIRGGRDGDHRARLTLREGELVIGILRTTDLSAPSSRGTLGPPFALAPSPPAAWSRAESATIAWSPRDPGAHVEVELSGSCIEPVQRSLGLDPGTLQLERGALRAREGLAHARCRVVATIRRTRLGDLDRALDQGGCFRLHQVRTLEFESTP